MQSFAIKATNFVKKIPKGKVASYGQVAAAAGFPKLARQVGGILRNTDVTKKNLPWWRVVNNRGIISIKGNWMADKVLQRVLLLRDGVKVSKNFGLDMTKYRFKISIK